MKDQGVQTDKVFTLSELEMGALGENMAKALHDEPI
jgi:hypothetical protein